MRFGCSRCCLMAVLFTVAAVLPARAQSGAAFLAFEQNCAAVGGYSNHDPNNPVCTPGDGPVSDPAGGYSADQQAMLNLAGQFGSALGSAIRESFQRAARQRQMNEIQEAYEREQARQRAAQEYELQRQRNEQLLAGMHGTIRTPELGQRQVGSEELHLRSSDEMFNMPNASGIVTQDVPSAQVDLAELQRINVSYFLAMDDANDADADVRHYLTNVEASEGFVREAQAYVDQAQLALSGIPPGSPGRADAEARLAESQSLLANMLEGKAEQEANLREAQADAAFRRRVFNDVQQQRYRLVRNPSDQPGR